MLEFTPSVASISLLGVFNLVRANFISNGGCSMSIPGGSADPNTLAESLRTTLPRKVVDSRFRASTLEKSADPCLFRLPIESIRACFSSVWGAMAALKGSENRPCFVTIGVDLLEHIFRSNEILSYVERTTQIVRRNKDVIGLWCGSSADTKEKISGICESHLKFELIEGALTVHSMKPPTPITTIKYDSSYGYPHPEMVPVV